MKRCSQNNDEQRLLVAKRIFRAKVTIASQKQTLDDQIASDKFINNCLVYHHVYASLRNSLRFQKSGDCKGIQRHDIYVAG